MYFKVNCLLFRSRKEEELLKDYHKDIRVKEEQGQKLIFSPAQKKWLVLTPEEMVRQMVVYFLHKDTSISISRMSLEGSMDTGEFKKRYDLLAFDRQGNPLLLAECKTFSRSLSEINMAQLLEYNATILAPYLLLTNGREIWFGKKPNYDIKPISRLTQISSVLSS